MSGVKDLAAPLRVDCSLGPAYRTFMTPRSLCYERRKHINVYTTQAHINEGTYRCHSIEKFCYLIFHISFFCDSNKVKMIAAVSINYNFSLFFI